jgi:hypothetical protein
MEGSTMQDHSTPKKICKDCHVEKDKTEFAKNSRACNPCLNARSRESYARRFKGVDQPRTELPSKICSKCSVEKPVSEFYRAIRYRLGVTGECKECKAKYTRQYEDHIKLGPKPISGSKACKKCGTEKKLSEFSFNAGKIDGRSAHCKECRRRSEWRERNKEDGKSYSRYKENYLRWNYGISLAQFDAILDTQKRLCAICDVYLTRPFVDHNHETGEIRGFVCCRCNTLVGYIERGKQGIVGKIYRYLEEPPCRSLNLSVARGTRADQGTSPTIKQQTSILS